MADDIAERLRSAARSGDLPLGVAFDCDAVADEIERLRAAGDALAEALSAWIDGMDAFEGDQDRLNAWQEARHV